MITVKQYVNENFTSNTYLISQAKSNTVWLVDLGAFDIILKVLHAGQRVAGVFLTHYHYDHIYHINLLATRFPDALIYVFPHTIEGLYDPKLNLSFYHEDPVIYNGSNTVCVKDNENVTIFDGLTIHIKNTPGHNPGALSFKVDNFLFTGDAYVPGYEVVTKLKGGNKADAKNSLKRIRSLLTGETIVCPGHGPMVKAPETLSHLNSILTS